MNNCPNCGAPINEERCPFCGTVFIDWAVIDMDKPFYLKFKHDNIIFRGKCICDQSNVIIESDDTYLYYDDRPCMVKRTPRYSMDIHLDFLPDKNGTMITKIDTDVIKQDTLKGMIDNG